jgi:hypothetical protein
MIRQRLAVGGAQRPDRRRSSTGFADVYIELQFTINAEAPSCTWLTPPPANEDQS